MRHNTLDNISQKYEIHHTLTFTTGRHPLKVKQNDPNFFRFCITGDQRSNIVMKIKFVKRISLK